MIKYKITLEPMGAFFFGGERSFSISSKDDKGNYLDPEDELSSYIVESNMFPQQTALLGMLRFTLLKNSTCFNLSENKIENTRLAKKIIGEHGFKVTNSKNNYGVIDNIDTCYIEHNHDNNNDILMPTPLDYGLDISFYNAVTANYNSKEIQIPFIKDINAKDGNKQYSGKTERVSGLININNGKFTPYKDVFKKDIRVGINRDIKTGKTDDGALFKQVFYRLEKGYRFCFYATFTDDTIIPKNTIVELGGDSSKFAITFNKLNNGEKEPDNFDKAVKGCVDKPSVILLADTLVDNEDYIYAISENIPFKFLVSTVDNTIQYSRMPRDKDKRKTIDYLHKSKRYSLYKRGSVFYFNEDSNLEDIKAKAKAFANAIENSACFNQIGYNKCIIK